MSKMQDDLRKAAVHLEEFAEIAKNSNTCAGEWPYESDKIEYDELRRLAGQLRWAARQLTPRKKQP